MTKAEKALCSGARGAFSDWMDGAPLPLLTRAKVRFHLAFCPLCRQVYRSLEATDAAVKALQQSDDSPPTER